MNEKLYEKGQLKDKMNQISNSFLLLKRMSSKSMNENKLNQRSQIYKKTINSQKILYNSTIKSEPLKVFNSISKEKQFPNTQRTRLIRTITSYNHTNKKIKLDTYNPRTNIINKRKNFHYAKTLNSHSKENMNSSKSSDKSSSIFITSRNNNYINNNYYKRINYKGHQSNDPWGIIDPLAIPEEDKIFDELKKIKSLTERYNKKYRTSNEDDLFEVDQFDNKQKENEKERARIEELFYNSIKAGSVDKKDKKNFLSRNRNITNTLSKTFYNKNYFKLSMDSKDLLDNLYMTSDDFFKQLNKIKKNKKDKKLKEYQNELLDLIQPIITKDGFRRLKNRFRDIKKKNRMKNKWDFKYLYKIENEEEQVINDINYYYNRYNRDENCKENYFSKHSVKYFDLNLPNLEFNRVLKMSEDEEYELKNKKNRMSTVAAKLKKIKMNTNESNKFINSVKNLNSNNLKKLYLGS